MRGNHMATTLRVIAILALTMSVACTRSRGQNAPASPESIWHSNEEQGLQRKLASHPESKYDIDPHRRYTLPELIDLAQRHNPETRVAWEQAKAQAASLGVALSALFPTLAAVVLGSTIRQATLLGEFFHRQTLGVFEPVLRVEYLVFDFG